MSGNGDGPGPSVRERVEELADENRWEEIHGLLAGRDRSEVVRDTAVAYRFGQALYYTGRLEELGEFLPEFEAHARDSAAPRAVMRVLILSGARAFETGEVERAESCYGTLMELAEGENDQEMQAHAANNLGAVAALHGEVEESLSYYQLAAPLYQRLDRPRGLAQMHHNMAIAYRDLERLADASDSYRRAAALAEGIGHTSQVALSTVGRAEIELLEEDVPLARELIRRGLEKAREVGDPLSEADALRVRGLIRVSDSRDTETALEDLHRARGLAGKAGNRFMKAEVERDTAGVLVDMGRDEEAREMLESAIGSFEALGARLEAERARDRLAGIG